MLVHICCSVDSHIFLSKLRDEYPDSKLVGYFYNPNIHPFSEYYLRLLDVKYSCDKLGIEIIDDEYDLNSWLNMISGYENEPEKGKRCNICFDIRLKKSIEKAKELGHSSFTSTLLMSSKKSQDMLNKVGKELERVYNIKWIFKDYRSGGGVSLQSALAKEVSLYRQDYCGCFFALKAQRQEQGAFMDEMICDIGKQILPGSIESRIWVFKKRNALEEKGKKYRLIKKGFLNYRLLLAKVKIDNHIAESYILSYSFLKKQKTSARIEWASEGIYYLNRFGIILIDIDKFNHLAKKNYKNTLELLYNPIAIEEEKKIRNDILGGGYTLSPIIVLDKVLDKKYDIFIDAIAYKDEIVELVEL